MGSGYREENTLQSSIDLVQLRHAEFGCINHGSSLSSSHKFTMPNLSKKWIGKGNGSLIETFAYKPEDWEGSVDSKRLPKGWHTFVH